MSKRPPPINPSDPAQIRKANEDLALLIRRLQSCLDDALSEGLAPRGMADILDHAVSGMFGGDVGGTFC